MALNMTYREIVRAQSLIRGRDANVTSMEPPVHREVKQDQPAGVEEPEAPWYPRLTR
ncbi:hypothetical protein [Rubrimonas cliftonensis]|uniref:Uncharacterized protein n=1 Tax=Rubrimonas cliftonensis TaxID=89524 RepID=A0A1H4FWC8_9RHOB|nr:hypothetical protein [Rubrimonas cliftonensis]SEB00938.1 hypothetical protein SAMN05444370_1297 [Rubrimonas cliftonensis]